MENCLKARRKIAQLANWEIFVIVQGKDDCHLDKVAGSSGGGEK